MTDAPALPTAQLEERLEALRLNYDRYFAGLVRIVPTSEHDALKRLFRRAVQSGKTNTAERFRLNTLRARLTTYEGRWTRICRAIEEGTYARDQRRADALKARIDANETAERQRPKGLTTETMDKLHTAYAAALRQLGKPSVDPEAFQRAVQKQAEAVRAKHGCRHVRFNVSVKKGKAVLQIRPKI